MNDEAYKWDFFLAHASTDKQIAKRLYDLLQPHCRVFLDDQNIQLGDDWDQELARAQSESLITVVLVSERTDTAYYQREEIAAAIDLARSEDKSHRVIPVYLDGPPTQSSGLPYGLRLKHGLAITKQLRIEEVANKLLQLLGKLPPLPPVQPPRIKPPRIKSLIWGAVALVAAALLVVAVVKMTPDREDAEDAAELPAAVPAVSEGCVSVTHLSPNVIPHYLLSSIGSKNFPYWLKLIAVNNCPEDKFMTVRFERGQNIVLQDPPQTETFKVPATGEPVSKIPTALRFDLSQPRIGSIAIQWSIEDENETKIDANTISTAILQPYTIAWDLERPKPEGGAEPVDPGYLLASLRAWTLKPPGDVAAAGKACRTVQDSPTMLSKERAIESCYQELFSGDGSIPVTSAPIEFPAGKRQVIRPHLCILKDRLTVSSLEAALLFAAVMEAQHIDGVDHKLKLLVAPVEGTADPDRKKTTYIAWQEAGRPWRAVDMSRANSVDFAENTLSASARVGTILNLNSEIPAAIEKRGAGFSSDKRIAAVDFGRIPPDDEIRKLGLVGCE